MQTRTVGQAALQRRILAELSLSSAPSVAELARRVGSTRPSVSRAVHALESRAFVLAAGRSWSLTEQGRAEVASLSAPAPQFVRAAAKEARRLGDINVASLFASNAMTVATRHVEAFSQAMKAAQGMSDPTMASKMLGAWGREGLASKLAVLESTGATGLASKILAAQTVSPNFAQSVLDGVGAKFSAAVSGSALEAARQAQDSQAELFGKSLAVAMSSQIGLRIPHALTEALKSQQYVMNGMVAAAAFAPKLMPDLSESLALSGRIVADASGLDRVLSSRRRAVQVYGRPLASFVVDVLTAHAHNVKASFERGDASTRLRASLLGPTEASGQYIAGARGLLERPTRDGSDAAFDHDPSPYIREIRRLDSVAADNWQAAYDRAREAGPSWSVQASHAARESLRLVLKRLSPDAPAASTGKVHVETRISTILRPVSGTLSGWGSAVYLAIKKTYALLSAEAHQEDDPRLNPAGMVGVLRATEGLVVVLLSYWDDRE